MKSTRTAPPVQVLQVPSGVAPYATDWLNLIGIATLHALAPLAFVPWFFDWRIALIAIAALPSLGFSINLCYHRQLAHRSFRTPKWLEHTFVCMALCCLQGAPARWVANHRKHHANADRREDPHSPLVSLFWAQAGWLFASDRNASPLQFYDKYVRDILSDPWYMHLERSSVAELIYLAHAAAFAAIGAAIGFGSGAEPAEIVRLAFCALIWCVVLRTVVSWHFTWSVNSLCHRFGYRNYETADHSRNNVFVSLIAGGEGWHNNHHADPACATTQRKPWELDVTFYFILILEKCGLAKDVVRPSHPRSEAKRQAQSGNQN